MALLPVYRKGDVVAHALVDDDDLASLAVFRWTLTSSGYVYRYESGKPIGLHRQLLGLKRGDPRVGDHINRNPLDNRRCNLRVATRAEDRQNQRPRSGRRGVSFHAQTGRWRARVKIAEREHYLGLFDSEEAAAEAASAFRRQNMPFASEATP